MGSPLQVAAFVALVLIAGGVREELQRAFLLHRFEQSLGGPVIGVVVTSVAFGLGHTLQGWDAAVVTGTTRRIVGRVCTCGGAMSCRPLSVTRCSTSARS